MLAIYAALNPGRQTTARRWVREDCPSQWGMFEQYPPLRKATVDFTAAAEASSPRTWLAEVSPDWKKAMAAE
jgi:hypothetical protein